jgi:tetratricopeptide (TPR) repeat protein
MIEHLLPPVLKTSTNIFLFYKSKLEKNFTCYSALKKLGISTIRDDFNYCYLETLYFQIHEKNKNKSIIKLFALKEVESAFQKEIYESSSDSFELAFEDNLHTNPQLRVLKNLNISIDEELREFRDEFIKVVQTTRKPKEISNSNQLAQIQKTLDQIQNEPKLYEASLIEDLEFPKELMGSENYQQALLFYENYKKTKWQFINSELKFKVLANIGICHINLNNEREGASSLIEASKYKLDDAKALGLASVGHHLVGDEIEARSLAHDALALDKENINGWMVLIRGTSTLDELKSILEEVPESIKKNPTLVYSIHLQFKGFGDLKRAEEYLRLALSDTSAASSEILAALATVFLDEMSDPFKRYTQQFSKEDKHKIQEGIDLLDKAIAQVKNKDLLRFRWWWYINRGVAKKLLGNISGALDDMRKAFDVNSDELKIIEHLAVSLYENKLYPEALEIFRKLASKNGNDEMSSLAIAESLSQLNQNEEAENILNPLINKANNQLIRRESYSLLIRIKTAAHQFEAAEQLAKEAIAKDNDAIQPYLDLSMVYVAKGDKGSQTQTIFKAYELMKSNTDKKILSELGDHLFAIEEFEKAADVYSRIVNEDVYTPTSARLIKSFLNIGKTDKAISLAKNLHEKHGLVPQVVEVESFIYESIGDVDKAISICEEFFNHDPSNQDIIMRLVNLCFRKNDSEKLTKYLPLITDFGRFSFELRYKLSFLYYSLGKVEDSLEIAYTTWRDNYSNGKSHLAFIQLSTNIKPKWDELLNLEVAKKNTTVTLEDAEKNNAIFTLLDYQPIFPDRDELSIDSDLAIRIIDKKIGDEITIDSQFSKPKTYIINSIVHKFAYAQRTSFEFLNNKFIDTPGFQSFKFQPEDEDPRGGIKPINALLDEQEEYRENILANYRKGILPIGTLASMLNQNPIEIWGSLFNPDLGINTLSGIANENQDGIIAIKNKAPIILDIISILILNELKILDKLRAEMPLIIVSNSTLELINEEILKLQSYPDEGIATIFKKDGAYYKDLITKENINSNIGYLNNLKEWVIQNCEVLPCEKALTMTSFEKERLDKVFGQSFYESILIAQDKGMILFSDDGILRRVAKQQFSVNGFSTPYLLAMMLNDKMISKEEYHALIFKMHSLSYRGLIISADIIWLSFEHTKYKLEHPFSSVLQLLSFQSTKDSIAVASIISEFLYKLYTTINLHPTQDLICNTIFQYSIPGRGTQFIQILILKLKNRFNILPRELDRIYFNLYQLLNSSGK